MDYNCLICGKNVCTESELNHEMYSRMIGAIGYGFDPQTLLGFKCNLCDKCICLQCAADQSENGFKMSHDCKKTKG